MAQYTQRCRGYCGAESPSTAAQLIIAAIPGMRRVLAPAPGVVPEAVTEVAPEAAAEAAPAEVMSTAQPAIVEAMVRPTAVPMAPVSTPVMPAPVMPVTAGPQLAPTAPLVRASMQTMPLRPAVAGLRPAAGMAARASAVGFNAVAAGLRQTAMAQALNRPVVVTQPAGTMAVVAGRSQTYLRLPAKPGLARERVMAVPAPPLPKPPAAMPRQDTRGAQVVKGAVQATSAGARAEVTRQAPPAFARTAAVSPYRSIARRR